jgi:hypothetical protein
MDITYEITRAELDYRAARSREELHPTAHSRRTRLLRTRRPQRRPQGA